MDSRDMELYEEYQSPFDFNSGVNKTYLYLSPSGNMSPPGSPVQNFGLLKTEPVAEEGEDAVNMLSAPENLSEEEQEELRRELAKVEEEIQTLSQVLAAKERHLADIKRKLGISSLQELKQNIAKGWQDVTATSAYRKTSETLTQAGQKASAAFSSVGSVITKKLEDVKLQAFSHSFSIRSIQHSISMPAMRNSSTFKSFEEKVENLKSKVGGTKPAGGDFGEVLNSTSATSAMSTETPLEPTEQSP
ncbi:tumor protein D52 isoform X2 [Peromyscus maniculatus bairdii]|uniref:Tumor protein D52 n=2 Tax=Peromyscus maniculatus bairdii TaxID=230844 RepID=A0A6I9LEX0_PERMB|nr:tumor protein D52 isoform X2 [Peromyscus maniculatus bairdii]